MNNQSIRIRTMSREDLDMGLQWAADEGWNPGWHDADSFHAADPEGFLLGECDGQPVGMISAVRYAQDFGFIGFYIVRPEFRGKGLGLQIWNAGMARLQGRLVGLDGVVAQQANYARSGFRLAYNNVRYQGHLHLPRPMDHSIVTLDSLAPAVLERYDADLFPAPRATFLHHWVRQQGSVALGLLGPRGLCGYGVIRPCRSGYKVGPLFADDADGAQRLLQALVARIPDGAQVQIDLAVPHQAACQWVTGLGLQAVFETARMYTGPAPAIDMARQFAVTTFELG